MVVAIVTTMTTVLIVFVRESTVPVIRTNEIGSQLAKSSKRTVALRGTQIHSGELRREGEDRGAEEREDTHSTRREHGGGEMSRNSGVSEDDRHDKTTLTDDLGEQSVPQFLLFPPAATSRAEVPEDAAERSSCQLRDQGGRAQGSGRTSS